MSTTIELTVHRVFDIIEHHIITNYSFRSSEAFFSNLPEIYQQHLDLGRLELNEITKNPVFRFQTLEDVTTTRGGIAQRRIRIVMFLRP